MTYLHDCQCSPQTYIVTDAEWEAATTWESWPVEDGIFHARLKAEHSLTGQPGYPHRFRYKKEDK